MSADELALSSRRPATLGFEAFHEVNLRLACLALEVVGAVVLELEHGGDQCSGLSPEQDLAWF